MIVASVPDVALRAAVGDLPGVEVVWEGHEDPDPRIELCLPDNRDLRHFERLGELPTLRCVQTQLRDGMRSLADSRVHILITPHVAGGTTAMLPRMAALARDQLRRYVAGDPLRNVVRDGSPVG